MVVDLPLQEYKIEFFSLQVMNEMLDEHNFSYLDPDKRLRVSDNTLKLIQKQALLDYYQRHSQSSLTINNNNKVKISPAGSSSSGPGPDGAGLAGVGSSSGLSGQDSGFYSPTESGPPRTLEDHSAVINGGDHPDQSSTELNGLEVS